MLKRFRAEPVRAKRPRTRRLGLLAALAVGAAVLVQSGSAATNVKPYTASFDPGPVGGGSATVVHLTITNLAGSQTLGSANVTAPTAFSLTGASLTQGSADWTSSPGTLELRDLAIAPGTSATIGIDVTTPCEAGAYTWGIEAKQSNDFNGPPGNDFTLQAGSNLTTSVSSNGCKLAWIVEPGDGVVNRTLTGSGGATVEVDAEGADGTLLPSATGTVTLTPTGSSCFSGTSATLIGGKATFPILQSSCAGIGLRLTASSPGYASADTPDTFDVYDSLTQCSGTSCSTPLVTLGGTTEQATGSGDFLKLGIAGDALGYVPAGCQTFAPVSSEDVPVAVVDQRTSLSGNLYVTYGVKISAIKKKYSNTSGQQFIPICAGAQRIAVGQDGKTYSVPCYDDYGAAPQTGWWGKTLDGNGNFVATSLSRAVCDPKSGYFFGILGSFQDYTNSNKSLIIDPNDNPTVSSWTSDPTNTYRLFTIRYPSASDTDSAGTFASVPWDGWNFG